MATLMQPIDIRFTKELLMDFSLLSVIATSLTTARELGKTAIGLRDFNQIAAAMSQINDQLLKAQDSLFSHNTQLHALQQDNFGMANRLRELEEKLAERGRYTLVEISDRTFVLQSNSPIVAGDQIPHGSEPLHYICQPCMAKGIKSVLQKYSFYGSISLECPVCKERFSTGKTEPCDR